MKKTILFFLIFCFFLLFIPLEAQTWSSLKRLTWNSGGSEYPQTTIDSSNVIHLVWDENPPLNNEEIYYKKSANSGTSWSPPKGELFWWTWG